MYDIRLLTIETLLQSAFKPHRVIINKTHPNLNDLVATLHVSHPNAEIVQSKPSTYKGVLRNVPTPETGDFVAIGFQPTTDTSAAALGPILVLVGLQYKGNVGTIVRTAVQSNLYQKICLVDVQPNKKDTAQETKTEPTDEKVWDKNKHKPITDDDVVYYSLCNAPLIEICRFKSETSFLEYAATTERAMVGVDGGTTVYGSPINVLHPSSWAIMKRNDLFVVLGSETHGLSSTFLDKCDHLAMLPCLSASINVAACFASVDTVIKIARQAT